MHFRKKRLVKYADGSSRHDDLKEKRETGGGQNSRVGRP